MLSNNHSHTAFKYINILDLYEAQLCVLVSNGQFIARIYIFVTFRKRISSHRSSKYCPLLWTDYHMVYIPVKTGTITFSVWRKTGVNRYKVVETSTVVV